MTYGLSNWQPWSLTNAYQATACYQLKYFQKVIFWISVDEIDQYLQTRLLLVPVSETKTKWCLWEVFIQWRNKCHFIYFIHLIWSEANEKCLRLIHLILQANGYRVFPDLWGQLSLCTLENIKKSLVFSSYVFISFCYFNLYLKQPGSVSIPLLFTF